MPSGKQGKAALFDFEKLPKDLQAKLDLMEARVERKADADQVRQLAAPASVETGTAVAVADAFKPRQPHARRDHQGAGRRGAPSRMRRLTTKADGRGMPR